MNSTNENIAPIPSPRSHHDGDAADAADFQRLRPRLFGIAYRMLGRAADAEDVVQDVWLRWQGVDRERVRDHMAYLATITTRTTLNFLALARVQREIPVARWLPGQEPVTDDPSLTVERTVDLEQGVVVMLQRLSPAERAVFVLREAFGYPFRDIAEVLGLSEANARQIRRRAGEHLAGGQLKPLRHEDCDRLVGAVLDAGRVGALEDLERTLAGDVLAHRLSAALSRAS
ncbi:sigma-70 family RNA polymerase sigma factor [Lentzea sp. JNUCC 0626]|uniref:sigma-70 family RNA polymerase sigma factor n=1 Tax=Lentzea sp. JNUCC 0626 TaxID=3367513 RepID=UPI0037492EE3